MSSKNVECDLYNLIKDFINGTYENYQEDYSVATSLRAKNKTDKYIYNEFSLQHELGSYLREILKDYNYKIKFEANLKKDYDVHSCKSECDLLILNQDGNPEYAIELKYLTDDCAVPRRMFQCIEDMIFMNDTVKQNKSFIKTYCVVITENSRFYEGEANRNIDIIKMHLSNLEKGKNNKTIEELSRIETQLEYLHEIEKYYETNPNKYPSIYEYFRNNNEKFWKNGKYIYSQIKNEEPVILKKQLNGQVEKLEWLSIEDVDEKYKYYILEFQRRM